MSCYPRPACPGRRPSAGPLVLVCPELAMEGPGALLEAQAMRFSDWAGPVFVLGGAELPGGGTPARRDYLEALRAVEAGADCYRFRCGTGITALTTGVRLLVRHAAFRAAVAGGGAVQVTGALVEAHVRHVTSALLRDGVTAEVCATAIAYCDIAPEAVRGMLARPRRAGCLY